MDRAMELTKIEAFDHWMDGPSETKEQITTKTLLDRVTTKLAHTFWNLKFALHQVTLERDELQSKIEQQEEEATDPCEWERLIGYNKIEDPSNVITATMKNLPPPMSIYQYYQAYKPMLFNWSKLPDIKIQTHLSMDEFETLWAKATPEAKDHFHVGFEGSGLTKGSSRNYIDKSKFLPH